MLLYYSYLMLSNNTLAIFNCQPSVPSDGYRYMVAVGTQGGLCYREGTVQQQLEPYAIIAFIVYTIGFPVFVAYILYSNKSKIVYAQVMKALGKSETQNEKRSIVRFRMMYNRLYYQFKVYHILNFEN